MPFWLQHWEMAGAIGTHTWQTPRGCPFTCVPVPSPSCRMERPMGFAAPIPFQIQTKLWATSGAYNGEREAHLFH